MSAPGPLDLAADLVDFYGWQWEDNYGNAEAHLYHGGKFAYATDSGMGDGTIDVEIVTEDDAYVCPSFSGDASAVDNFARMALGMPERACSTRFGYLSTCYPPHPYTASVFGRCS